MSTHSMWLTEEGIEPKTGAIVSCDIAGVAAARAIIPTGRATILAHTVLPDFLFRSFAVAMSGQNSQRGKVAVCLMD